MQVEMVIALALERNAAIAGHLAARARRLKGKLADGARVGTLDIPFPGGNGMPAVNLDLHPI